MKKAKNGLFKNLSYLCLTGVMALGLMVIVTTGGCGGGGEGSDIGVTVDQIMTFAPSSFTYYSEGQPNDLAIFTEQIAINVADGKMDQLKTWLENDPLIKQPLEIEELGRKDLILVALIDEATEDQILELIGRLNATGLISFSSPVFGDVDDMSLITDEFIVRFKDSYSVADIENFIAGKHVNIIKRDFLWPKCYILGFTAQSGSNTLEVAREFYESGMVEFAHPNFITVMKPLWHPVLEEDFEEGFPQDCEAYDDNPADGEYYWGRVSSDDYPSKIDDLTEGSYKCWVAASHDPESPDLHPDDQADETYAPNMDAWLKFGPYDLSQYYWSHFMFTCEDDLIRYSYERMKWLVSVDGQNWHEAGGGAGSGYPCVWWGHIVCRNVPDFGNIDGAEQVWFALRFTSNESTSGYPDEENEQLGGVFVDDIRLMVSNTEPAPAITTDEFSPRQWALHNVGQSGGDPGWDINVVPAWDFMDITPGIPAIDDQNDGIIVAVIDEGVDLDHEDLNLVAGYDATYDPEDPERVDSHGGPNPWDGHGTACAGIVGAIQNQVGIAGVAPGAKIMPVRIAFSQEGSTHWTTSDDEIADGILWAANNGAKVLSNSWGGGRDTDMNHNAIRDAKDMGCTLVFSAGNSNFSPVKYPARYPETIAVGAMSPCGERTNHDSCDGEWFWGSNYGPNLNVMAPGVMIPTCDITGDGGYTVNDDYGHLENYFMSFNGTSSACPHVAGIAALMLTTNPNLSPNQVQEILEETAVDLGDQGFDEETGYGLVNAHEAILEAWNRNLDLRISQWVLSSASPYPGQEILSTMTLESYGPAQAGNFRTRVYFSSDNAIDSGDDVLADFTLTLEPGESRLRREKLVIPQDATIGDSYFIILSIDDDKEVEEISEDNNTVSYLINVVRAPNLVVKPENVDFGLVVVGSGAQKTLRIKNEGETTLATLTITDISFSGDEVLFNNPDNQIPSIPFELETNEDTELWLYFVPDTVGNYSGTITITSNDPDEPVKEIPLTGTAVAALPDIHVQDFMMFNEPDTQQTLNIENQGNAVLTWTIGPDQQIPWPNWLSVSPLEGQTAPGATSAVDVTVDRSGLAIGTYVYNIYISSNDPNNPSVPVLITLSVATEPPVLVVKNTPVDFGPTSTFEYFYIENHGGRDLNWTISNKPACITINLESGTTTPGATSNITLTASRNMMPVGEYSWDMSITSNGGNATVHITMTVPDQTISVDPTLIDFGQTNTSDSFTIENTGSFEIDWTMADNPPSWLSADSTSGSLDPGESIDVHLTVDRTGWDPGTYQHTIAIGSTGGSADVEVTMVVPQPVILLSPTDLHFNQNNTEDTFNITNEGGGTLNWSINPDTDNWPYWLEVLPMNGETTSGNSSPVIVTVDIEGLDPSEVYIYDISITSNGGSGSVSVIWSISQGWSKTYGHGEGYTEYHTYGFDVTDDGGYVYTAETRYNGAGNADFWVVKLDADGNIQWEKGFGGESIDEPESVRQTSDGGYIVAGNSYSFRTGDHYCDMWVIKLNSSGGIEWQHNYGGTGYDVPKDVQETFDSQGASTGYMLAGYTTSFGAGGYDIWVVKIDTSGGIEWQKTYGGTNNEFGRSIQQVFDQDGNPDGYVMTADTQSFGAGGRDAWVLKLGNSGAVEWEKTYGGSGLEMPQSIQVASDGGYVVGAYTDSFGAGGNDFWAFKIDAADGSLDWQYTYGGMENDYAMDLKVTADHGYVMTGWTYSFDSIENDAWVVKLDSSGVIEWQKIYNKPYEPAILASDWAYAVIQTIDGGYAIAGDTDFGDDDRNSDVWIFKVDPNGALGCDIETDTDAVPTQTTVSAETTVCSTSDTVTVAGTTDCTSYDTAADVFTQCGP